MRKERKKAEDQTKNNEKGARKKISYRGLNKEYSEG